MSSLNNNNNNNNTTGRMGLQRVSTNFGGMGMGLSEPSGIRVPSNLPMPSIDVNDWTRNDSYNNNNSTTIGNNNGASETIDTASSTNNNNNNSSEAAATNFKVSSTSPGGGQEKQQSGEAVADGKKTSKKKHRGGGHRRKNNNSNNTDGDQTKTSSAAGTRTDSSTKTTSSTTKRRRKQQPQNKNQNQNQQHNNKNSRKNGRSSRRAIHVYHELSDRYPQWDRCPPPPPPFFIPGMPRARFIAKVMRWYQVVEFWCDETKTAKYDKDRLIVAPPPRPPIFVEGEAILSIDQNIKKFNPYNVDEWTIICHRWWSHIHDKFQEIRKMAIGTSHVNLKMRQITQRHQLLTSTSTSSSNNVPVTQKEAKISDDTHGDEDPAAEDWSTLDEISYLEKLVTTFCVVSESDCGAKASDEKDKKIADRENRESKIHRDELQHQGMMMDEEEEEDFDDEEEEYYEEEEEEEEESSEQEKKVEKKLN